MRQGRAALGLQLGPSRHYKHTVGGQRRAPRQRHGSGAAAGGAGRAPSAGACRDPLVCEGSVGSLNRRRLPPSVSPAPPPPGSAALPAGRVCLCPWQAAPDALPNAAGCLVPCESLLPLPVPLPSDKASAKAKSASSAWVFFFLPHLAEMLVAGSGCPPCISVISPALNALVELCC